MPQRGSRVCVGSCSDIATVGQDHEHAAVRLLALQAPVAGELRQVVTAVQIVGDLTRMGVLAEHMQRLLDAFVPCT